MFLQDFQKQFNPELTIFFKKHETIAFSLGAESRRLYTWTSEFALRPGKRLRPALVAIGNMAAGCSIDRQVLLLSVAVELFHDFALIHDDIMDKADTRRGLATVHKLAEEYAQNSHFGLSSAILAGDLAFSLSGTAFWEALSYSHAEFKAVPEIFLKLRKEVILGQQIDLELGTKEGIPTEDEVLKVAEWKTANYSVIRPLELGYAFAKERQGLKYADPSFIKLFGHLFGIAFQIHDDIEGVFGDTKESGKPVGMDIKEGKAGLFIPVAFEHSQNKTKFTSIFKNENASENDIDWLKNEIVKTGALDYATSEALRMLSEAINILNNANLAATATAPLEELIKTLQFKLEKYKNKVIGN